MAKPITLITGEPFLIDQEVRKWTNAFSAKFGAESIFVFAEHPLPTKQIISTVTGGGLFASKSCVVIHGLPLSSDDKKGAKEKEELDQFTQWFVDHHQQLSSDVIIIFISPNPDKRGKLFKLFDNAGSESNLGLINHSTNQGSSLELITKQLGDRCTPQQCQYIGETIGTNDLYRIRHETNKIRDYLEFHPGITLTNNIIGQIITPHIEQDSFAVIDSIIYKSTEDTLKLIDRLQSIDDNPYGFLGLLYRGLRGVIATIDAMNHGIHNNTQLISITKLPPFTIGRITKNYEGTRKKLSGLQLLFCQLIGLEYQIKNGIVPVETFWPTVKTNITSLNK